ncbi:MAG: T9SS C-terminal target domain-containing protein [Verrucomicrobia bacterium]|nr:T9SS C-terminal target domain-containing protein [Verrucomicrobiota bacterium]
MKTSRTAMMAMAAWILAVPLCPGQTKQWDKSFGGSLDDACISVQQTADGGYILGGRSKSPIGGDLSQKRRGRDSDYWIVKTDASGAKQWDKRFGGLGSDEREDLRVVQQTTDGGYILGGTSFSQGGSLEPDEEDKTGNSWGRPDYWIVKVNAEGGKEWDHIFGTTAQDYLSSVQQTRDGGYILGGHTSGNTAGFEPYQKSEDSRGFEDYWIVKVNAEGGKEWDRCFGGDGHDRLCSVRQTSDGGYILGGSSDSGVSGERTQDSRGGLDYWIVKINASGAKEWDRRFGGSKEDSLSDLDTTPDGGFILGGTSWSKADGDKSEDSRGFEDYWIVKVDANGNKEWDRRFGGDHYDDLSSIQGTSDGGFILSGYSKSRSGGDKSEDAHRFDYWLVKLDSSGAKKWDKSLGGNDDDVLNCVRQTADGGYLLGGSSQSGAEKDKTESSRGGWDFWIVKLGPEAASTPPKVLTEDNL